MDHEFQFRIFRPEKQDYHFTSFVALKNNPLERHEKPCSIPGGDTPL